MEKLQALPRYFEVSIEFIKKYGMRDGVKSFLDIEVCNIYLVFTREGIVDRVG